MPLLVLPGDAPSEDWLHATLGRCVRFAASFEHDCQMMTLLFKIREQARSPLSDDEGFSELRRAVLDRLARLGTYIGCQAELPPDVADLLDQARTARNYFAHEAAEELASVAENTAARAQWCDGARAHIEALALGKVVLAILMSKNSASSLPPKEEVRTYAARAQAWAVRSFEAQAHVSDV